MLSSSDGSEQKNHCFSGSGASSSLTMKQAPSSVTASGSRLNHVRSSQPIESGFTLVPGSSMRAAAARLESADAAATRPSLLAVARVDGPATNELHDEQSDSMAMRANCLVVRQREFSLPEKR